MLADPLQAEEIINKTIEQRGDSWKYCVPVAAVMEKQSGHAAVARIRDRELQMDAADWIEWKSKKLKYEFGDQERAEQEARLLWAKIEQNPTKEGYVPEYINGRLWIYQVVGSERHHDQSKFQSDSFAESSKKIKLNEDGLL